MITNLEIRPADEADLDPLLALYQETFPDEDLLPVVRDLSRHGTGVLSLVGYSAGRLIGHVAFTQCSIERVKAGIALLAPLAVRPDCQRQGTGSALVRHGLKILEVDNVAIVFVLGDPNYYGRLGFKQEGRVAPPYTPLPPEWSGAWQSIPIGTNNLECSGVLLVPEPWQKPELWSA